MMDRAPSFRCIPRCRGASSLWPSIRAISGGSICIPMTLLPASVDAEDVLQEANLVLWRKFDQYQPGRTSLPGPAALSRYEVLKYREKRARAARLLDPDVFDQLADVAVSAGRTPRRIPPPSAGRLHGPAQRRRSRSHAAAVCGSDGSPSHRRRHESLAQCGFEVAGPHPAAVAWIASTPTPTSASSSKETRYDRRLRSLARTGFACWIACLTASTTTGFAAAQRNPPRRRRGMSALHPLCGTARPSGLGRRVAGSGWPTGVGPPYHQAEVELPQQHAGIESPYERIDRRDKRRRRSGRFVCFASHHFSDVARSCRRPYLSAWRLPRSRTRWRLRPWRSGCSSAGCTRFRVSQQPIARQSDPRPAPTPTIAEDVRMRRSSVGSPARSIANGPTARPPPSTTRSSAWAADLLSHPG